MPKGSICESTATNLQADHLPLSSKVPTAAVSLVAHDAAQNKGAFAEHWSKSLDRWFKRGVNTPGRRTHQGPRAAHPLLARGTMARSRSSRALDAIVRRIAGFATHARDFPCIRVVMCAWHPDTGSLWASVNECDELGDDVPPAYMTAVRGRAFYGFPFSYYGRHVDYRV